MGGGTGLCAPGFGYSDIVSYRGGIGLPEGMGRGILHQESEGRFGKNTSDAFQFREGHGKDSFYIDFEGRYLIGKLLSPPCEVFKILGKDGRICGREAMFFPNEELCNRKGILLVGLRFSQTPFCEAINKKRVDDDNLISF